MLAPDGARWLERMPRPLASGTRGVPAGSTAGPGILVGIPLVMGSPARRVPTECPQGTRGYTAEFPGVGHPLSQGLVVKFTFELLSNYRMAHTCGWSAGESLPLAPGWPDSAALAVRHGRHAGRRLCVHRGRR